MLKMTRNIPFHIHLSYLFIGLILALSIASGALQFTKISQIILAEVNGRYDLIGQRAATSILSIYEPARIQTILLAQNQVTTASSFSERIKYLKYLALTIQHMKTAVLVQISYQDGDFFLVRRVNNQIDQSKLIDAPPMTAWVAQGPNFVDGKPQGQQIAFFNSNFQEISRKLIARRSLDPRTRIWYQQAINQISDDPVASDPYHFFTTDEIGITYAKRAANGNAVVGIDISILEILSALTNQKGTPSSKIALVEADGGILALQSGQQAPYIPKLVTDSNGNQKMLTLAEQGDPVLNAVFNANYPEQDTHSHSIERADDTWATYKTELQIPGGRPLSLLVVSPDQELLKDVTVLRGQTTLLFSVLFVLGIIVTLYFARLASKPLKLLTDEARKIEQFNFRDEVQIQSRITEVDDLARSMGNMKATIQSFLDLSSSLASETNFETLLDRVLHELSAVTEANAGVLYLYRPQQEVLEAAQKFLPGSSLQLEFPPIALSVTSHSIANACVSGSVVISHDQEELHFMFGSLVDKTGAATLIAIPLKDRNDTLVGAIALLLKNPDVALGRQTMAEAISGTAAVAIENQRLIQEQKALLEAFIQLIAGAIDAKSPYTGGHCQRVPDLTKRLARAACEETQGPFADFKLSDSEWEQLHIAAWLHDCGKVTTPEYIVDKSTKLETLYDRIHEIRMRFEVLKRDAEIQYWKDVVQGGNAQELRPRLVQTLSALDADFAFVAQCNEGGEYMAPEKIERLQQIAKRSWKRTLSDRIGIAHEERQRKERVPESPLPVSEALIADKPEHIFARTGHDQLSADNPWGFKVMVPEHLYNRGELYNLLVSRGTLSNEERYKINEHMIQTIIMLEKLPFPRHLSRVPEIAGGHHEKMDGTGYPRKLTRQEMSIPARMMAIADIFEALTAADRPYKSGKKLSEAIRIMSFMRKDQHIDADLFALFLRSGVYLDYAHLYMDAAQIDEVDVAAYIEPDPARAVA